MIGYYLDPGRKMKDKQKLKVFITSFGSNSVGCLNLYQGYIIASFEGECLRPREWPILWVATKRKLRSVSLSLYLYVRNVYWATVFHYSTHS